MDASEHRHIRQRWNLHTALSVWSVFCSTGPGIHRKKTGLLCEWPQVATTTKQFRTTLYILVTPKEGAGGEKSDDCNCNPSTTAGRLPSQDDLMQSNQFTRDVSGSCVNLSVPNRTLRVFNYQAIVRHTDPDVANYMLRADTQPPTNEEPFPKTHYYLQRGGKVTRGLIDLDNPVQWQDVSEASADTYLNLLSRDSSY